jgi:hypothetical protein
VSRVQGYQTIFFLLQGAPSPRPSASVQLAVGSGQPSLPRSSSISPPAFSSSPASTALFRFTRTVCLRGLSGSADCRVSQPGIHRLPTCCSQDDTRSGLRDAIPWYEDERSCAGAYR